MEALVDQHADVEREQDGDLGGEREAEHLRAHRDLAVGEHGDDREGDQRPQLPRQVDVQHVAERDVREVRQRAEDADRRGVVGDDRDIGRRGAGHAAQAL